MASIHPFIYLKNIPKHSAIAGELWETHSSGRDSDTYTGMSMNLVSASQRYEDGCAVLRAGDQLLKEEEREAVPTGL